MSARRRRDREGLDLFAENGAAVPTLEETDSAIFSPEVPRLDVDKGRQVARPLSIFDIHPDVEQPRRAIPSVVRERWDSKPESMADLFGVWYHLASQERGEHVDIDPYLVGTDEAPRPEKTGPIESSLLEIVMLAANIRANGLTNPITVVHTSEGYRLETGERRWLAYHVLHAHFQDEVSRWEKIPARQVDTLSVWRQAGENNARANLNAVGKARQLAILVMDLYRQQGTRFAPYHLMVPANECDRAYYAQVADGNRFPIPRGNGEMVMNAMGFKQPSQLREHRGLLNLPDEVWRVADDLNWAQGRVRDLQRQADGDDDILTQLVYQYAFAEQYRVGIPTPEDIPNTPTPPRPVSPRSTEIEENGLFSRENKRRFNRLHRLAGKVGQGGGDVTHRDLDDIRLMRVWLDELERMAVRKPKR